MSARLVDWSTKRRGIAVVSQREAVEGQGTDLLDKSLLLDPLEELETEFLHLHQTNSHNRRLGVVSPSESIDESSCDGDDVLECSTETDTANIGSDGDPELRRVEERFPDGAVVKVSASNRRLREGTSCDCTTTACISIRVVQEKRRDLRNRLRGVATYPRRQCWHHSAQRRGFLAPR